jgi:hypothetical protein
VPLDVPIVTCVTDVATNPLDALTGVQNCTTVSTTSTTTTTVAPAP